MNQDVINVIVQIITNYGPSIVAIVTMIVSLVTAFKKLKLVSDEEVNTLKATNKTLSEELAESKKETRELKKLLTKAIAKQNKIHVPEE